MRAAKVGDRVRLTSKFLKWTGQTRGGEGASSWVIQACPCALCVSGRHVATDEPKDVSVGCEDQTEEWRAAAIRHVAAANLEKC